MARGGINKAVVQIARTALLARGEHPSIDAVRIELGNTGSKTTIHRYLKELEATERTRGKPAPVLSEQLAYLVKQLSEQMQEEAQASVAEERAALAREQLEHQQRLLISQERTQRLEAYSASLESQLEASQRLGQQELQLRQDTAVDNARLVQSLQDIEIRLRERDDRISSLEEMHRHARNGIEHFRQASKEQRETEQRRHEVQVQQLQTEIRQLTQTLMIKQDDLTQLNRDNARLLSEAQQLQRDLRSLQQQYSQKETALSTLQATLRLAEHQR